MQKQLPNKYIIGVAALVAAALIYAARRGLAERAQHDALQKYLEQMRQLLTKEGLGSSEDGSDVRELARSQTLRVLQGLGPDRKRTLLLFLYESHLIDNDNAIISLAGANLSEANLSKVNLSEADLSGANLSRSDLSRADLRGANLSEADLSKSGLDGVNLSEARNVTQEQLATSALRGATMPDGSKHD
jgi:hypothetical protein